MITKLDFNPSKEKQNHMHMKTTMVQTKSGTKTNPWIEYMQACAANYRQGNEIQSTAQGKKSKPRPDKTEESNKSTAQGKKSKAHPHKTEESDKSTLQQQTDSAIKQAKAIKGKKMATQAKERQEKAVKDQEEAAKATTKKMGNVMGKKIADQTGKI